mmetsp:Transcript_335/g.1212  ORF Transcript_335/g.1212 Transcript_335/m.1212 type:complete len:110 (-) Transcript_335:55-384(-)
MNSAYDHHRQPVMLQPRYSRDPIKFRFQQTTVTVVPQRGGSDFQVKLTWDRPALFRPKCMLKFNIGSKTVQKEVTFGTKGRETLKFSGVSSSDVVAIAPSTDIVWTDHM